MHRYSHHLPAATPVLFLITAAALLSITGCTSYRAALPGVAVSSSMGFQRADYEVLQTAKGQGCVTFVGMFPLPFFFVTAEDLGADLYGTDVGGRSREIAVYKAVQSIPDADALIIPRFHDVIETSGIWYHKVCSTVTGKAIRFKTDYQLRRAARRAAAQLQYAPQPNVTGVPTATVPAAARQPPAAYRTRPTTGK